METWPKGRIHSVSELLLKIRPKKEPSLWHLLQHVADLLASSTFFHRTQWLFRLSWTELAARGFNVWIHPQRQEKFDDSGGS